MDGHSDELAVRDSADFRSFAVEAWADRRAGGWPLSRFDISSRELRVRLSDEVLGCAHLPPTEHDAAFERQLSGLGVGGQFDGQ